MITEERFARKVGIAEDGCWPWTGAVMPVGYGELRVRGKHWYAHRYVYERFVEPIPADMTIDHLCRNRRCVNPDHLEVVTKRENIRRGESPVAENARKTHCAHGHPFDEANTRTTSDGRRVCRACHRERVARAKRTRRWQT